MDHDTRAAASRSAATEARRTLGRDGEELVRAYLENRGYEVVDTNWRCREGEIDLVAIDGGELVVVEVKTRRSLRFGRAVEAVTEEKHRRLRRLAGLWAAEHEVRARGVRVDVIGVEWAGETARIDHRKRVIL